MKTFNPKELFDGVFIPLWLLEAGGLSPGAKLCYCLMVAESKDGVYKGGTSYLASKISTTTPTISNYLKELRDCSLVRCVHEGAFRKKEYTFLVRHLPCGTREGICDSVESNTCEGSHVPPLTSKCNDSPGKNQIPSKNKDLSDSPDESLLHSEGINKDGIYKYNNIYNNKYNNNNIYNNIKEKENKKRKRKLKPETVTRTRSDLYALRFYDLYPVKQKRKMVLDIFFKLLKDKTEEQAEEFTGMLIDALRNQLEAYERRHGMGAWVSPWRHPTTWLNQAGWEDEVISNEKENRSESRTCKQQSGWDYSLEFERQRNMSRKKTS